MVLSSLVAVLSIGTAAALAPNQELGRRALLRTAASAAAIMPALSPLPAYADATKAAALYQEEEIFTEAMGLDADGNGGNAGLLNNICDGTSVSQTRKDSKRNLQLHLPRLNFLGNGHPFPWHVREQKACAVVMTRGQKHQPRH